MFSSVLCGFKSREDITKDAAARTLNFVIFKLEGNFDKRYPIRGGIMRGPQWSFFW